MGVGAERLVDHVNLMMTRKTCSIKWCLHFTFQKDEVFLNLVLEYVPETVYRIARHYSKSKQTIPILYIKVSSVCLY